MTVELEDIRAWVDGELKEPRASQINQAVLSDKKLQHTADKLRASQLPYREAFEQAPVPDVPESLRLKIDALQNSTPQVPQARDLPTKAANNSTYKMIGIAASVTLAALVGYLAGANKANPLVDAPVLADTTQPPDNFARTVAAYQKFYVRETLKGTVAPNPVKVSERLASQTDMQVIIPELEGYEFMRAQRLSVDGELLLQLVYLGAEGGPLALCYMVTPDSEVETEQEGKGTPTTLQNHHGLNTAQWQHNGHRFVIVSDAPEKQLEALSQSTKQQWSI